VTGLNRHAQRKGGRKGGGPPERTARNGLDDAAEAYVRLGLAMQRHDPAPIDYYLGPPAWRTTARSGSPRAIPLLIREAESLLTVLRRMDRSERRDVLEKQVRALATHLQILAGETFAWEDEARLLYDIALRPAPLRQLEAARERLLDLLPGRGDPARRVDRFLARMEIPPRRLRGAIRACLALCRERSATLLPLPSRERCDLVFVRGKPWAAYQWYRGSGRSRLAFNLDARHGPLALLDVTAHEGYPGHHVFHAIRDDLFLKRRGWVEFSLFSIYSPQSLLAEGLSCVALSVLLDRRERDRFILSTLAPFLGRVRAADLQTYLWVAEARQALRPALLEAGRMAAVGRHGEREIERFLARFGYGPKAARRNASFFRRYRTYGCTYLEGERLIRRAVGTGPHRFARYAELLRSLTTPSDVAASLAT
jgi:hypothetical protein